jgi:hypothetical protein
MRHIIILTGVGHDQTNVTGALGIERTCRSGLSPASARDAR